MLGSIRKAWGSGWVDAGIGAAWMVLSSGCLVDSDKPCGENQVVLEADFGGCICAPNAVQNAKKDGCDLCGEHEIVKEGACACEGGFARLTAGGPCTMSALEAPCTTSAECSGDYPYCAPGGYCTKGTCSTHADCPTFYGCEKAADSNPAYCSRPPAGQGNTCTTTADCTGEANTCAQGTCVVTGCATTTTCHGDWACCDFSQFNLPDLKDVCVAPSKLSNGKCPGTGADPVVR